MASDISLNYHTIMLLIAGLKNGSFGKTLSVAVIDTLTSYSNNLTMKKTITFAACFFVAGLVFITCKKEKLDSTHHFEKWPPVASGGGDYIVILPDNSVLLKGSGTDADGFVASYIWRHISGPTVFTMIKLNNALVEVKDMERGIYEFEFKVTDNNMLFRMDTVFVYVLDSLNDPINVGCAGCWDY